MFISKLKPPKKPDQPDIRLPDHVRRLADDEIFSFACHPGVPCFTECCRQLELALTPYDVLRLKNKLGISSKEFVDQYCLVEYEEGDIFPRVYLGMVDDGRASCPFVSEKGCRVYSGRPAPCRTYPLGRGAWQDRTGQSHSMYVLLQEEHCKGFAEPLQQSISSWITDQGLTEYFQANDLLVPLLQHEKIKQGFRPSAVQRDLYMTTLFDLENFSENAKNGDHTDLQLLDPAVKWLIRQLFGERSTLS